MTLTWRDQIPGCARRKFSGNALGRGFDSHRLHHFLSPERNLWSSLFATDASAFKRYGDFADFDENAYELTRKERTHRLCTHGAMLEQYLPSEEYTDEQIDKFLRTLFQIPEVMQILHLVKSETNEQPETQ